MSGLIRRTLLLGGLVAAGAGVALWRWRSPAGTEVAYGASGSQILDIHYPRGLTAKPVLVIFHPGLFTGTDKVNVPVWPEFLEAGIAVVRVDTRRSGEAPWPAQADDALAAIIHLQREGAALGLDPSRMVILGQGVGAYLAVTAALSMVEVGLTLKGVVSLYGPMDFSTLDGDLATFGRNPARGPANDAESPESRLLGFAAGDNPEAARAASPLAKLDNLREPLPPILIRHGDADVVVADLQAKRLREAWLAADPKSAIDYKLVPGAGHGGKGFETGEVRADVLAFVIRALA